MELGDLEAAVLGSVLRQGKASARQVAKDLEPSRGLAYSTISTTLDRLYKKGMLARDEAIGRGGSRYIYMLHSEEKVKGKVVKGFVDRLLTAFGPTVISTLSDYVDDIPKDELKRLEEKIRKGSKQRFPAIAADASVIAILLVVSRNEFLSVYRTAPELLGLSSVNGSHSAWKLVASITRICYPDDVHCAQIHFLTNVGENDGCTHFTFRDCHRFRRSLW